MCWASKGSRGFESLPLRRKSFQFIANIVPAFSMSFQSWNGDLVRHIQIVYFKHDYLHDSGDRDREKHPDDTRDFRTQKERDDDKQCRHIDRSCIYERADHMSFGKLIYQM